MTDSTHRLAHLGFLHIAPFSPEDPGAGLREAVELFRFTEGLGLDSGWLRTRHLQHGATAPGVMLGALSQATEHMELGNAVIPMEWENPFSLAEDLSVADVLSGGRLRPGLSVHPPRLDEETADAVFGPAWRHEDYSYERILRLKRILEGEKLRSLEEYKGYGGDMDSETLQPLSPGLASRLSYGAGSLKSAAWAGEHGLGLLVSNISSTENGVRDFDQAQAAQIRAYRQAFEAQHGTASLGGPGQGSADGDAAGRGRVAQARVVIPTDGTTREQKQRFEDYVAARTPRTTKVLGEKTIISPDRIGSAEQIVDGLLADPSFLAADDFIVELPFELGLEDWKHILEQFVHEIGPRLGWEPRR